MLLLALSGCAQAGADAQLPASEAHALVERGATLLDVRTADEWSGGHLDGAVHIPVSDLASRLAEVPKDRPVVVYCQAGGRSARATALLREAGYDARDLGGMARWGR